ncbi:unnamed protein product [Caretta caretta]
MTRRGEHCKMTPLPGGLPARNPADKNAAALAWLHQIILHAPNNSALRSGGGWEGSGILRYQPTRNGAFPEGLGGGRSCATGRGQSQDEGAREALAARPGMLPPNYSHSNPEGRGEQQGIRAKVAGNCPYPGNRLRQAHREHGGPELSPTGGGGGDEPPPAPGTRTAPPPPPPHGRSPAPHAARRTAQQAWARGNAAASSSPQGG